VQEADLIGHVACEAHLVRRDQHRHALLLELPHERQHLAYQLRVERARDLVHQQGTRTRGQRPHDRHALLLATRQPVRVVRGSPAQPEALEERAGPVDRLRPPHPLRPRRAEHHVLQHTQVGEQVERLDHEPKPAPHRHRVDRRVRDHLTVEENVAVVDLLGTCAAVT
jgi:hypothetical protein